MHLVFRQLCAVQFVSRQRVIRSWLTTWLPFVLLLVGTTLATVGCGPKQWEISVVNNGKAPCGVAVDLGTETSKSNARIDTVAPGETVKLLVSKGETNLKTITLTLGGKPSDFEVNRKIVVGNKVLIEVKPDGEIDSVVSSR